MPVFLEERVDKILEHYCSSIQPHNISFEATASLIIIIIITAINMKRERCVV